MNLLFKILIVIYLMIVLIYFYFCLLIMGHIPIIFFIFWLCSFLLNIGIMIFNKINNIKFLYYFLVVIFINFIIFTISIFIFYEYDKIYKLSIKESLSYFFHNYQYFIRIVFSLGNWLLPFIHSLWRHARRCQSTHGRVMPG
jgi:hypothetical protein